MKKIVLENLNFFYPGNKILRNINFESGPYSITSLIGTNGSGKTTLLLLLLGLINPNSGRILILNKYGESLKPEQLAGKIGYLPQIERFPSGFSIKDYVLLGRIPFIGFFSSPSKKDLFVTDMLISKLKLDRLSSYKLGEISGGELQRVRIARALAQNPDLILLDEPTTHLDIGHKKEIYQLLSELRDKGKTIFYSTHDPVDALTHSDYCIMLNGKLPAKTGRTTEIINSKNLSTYFHVESEIIELNSQKVILYK